MCMYIYIFVCVCVYVFMYVCMSVCMDVCMCICVDVWMCVCVFPCFMSYSPCSMLMFHHSCACKCQGACAHTVSYDEQSTGRDHPCKAQERSAVHGRRAETRRGRTRRNYAHRSPRRCPVRDYLWGEEDMHKPRREPRKREGPGVAEDQIA